MNVTGVAQGFVIGDHNCVNLTFTKHESFVPREAPMLPTHWVERDSLVDQAVMALTSATGGAVVALVGMGGAGKSKLAARIAAAVADRFARGCFWIDTSTAELDEAWLRMALVFGHDLSPLKSSAARASTVRSLLNGLPVLIVLDDVWSVEVAAAFLPPPRGVAILLTTRNDAIAANCGTHVIPVDRLTTAEGVALLANAAGAAVAEPALAQISESLGGLPLALELAAKLARQQSRRPGFSWPHFAAGFSTAAKRLGLGLAGTTVRAAFDVTWMKALDREGQRAFARLGLFQPGDISTAEVASAWEAETQKALEQLNALADLSLVQQVDAVTVRLHPLLEDYAAEKAQELPEPERIATHQSIADHLYAGAPSPSRTMADLRYVLRSHYHAGAALDRPRAERVYPWFEKHGEKVAVKGFLIDRGQPHTHAKHERIHWALLKDASLWARTWATYRLGEVLAEAGELAEARQHLEAALTLLDSPELDADSRVLGRSKFLMKLGHVRAQLGDLDGAVETMREMVEEDRTTVERGNVGGARSGALIGLLQLGDLIAQSGRSDRETESTRIYQDVSAEADRTGEAQAFVMAASRLAQVFAPADPVRARSHIQAARIVGEQRSEAFAGRQGARYARLLAATAAELTFTGEAMADDVLALLVSAIERASDADAQTEKGYALYALGNFLEHAHLLDRETPLGAVWACYSLATTCVAEHEDGAPLNSQERIDCRISPRIPAAERGAIEAAVAQDPWTLINSAIAPFTLRIK